jgi:hypothetical protein
MRIVYHLGAHATDEERLLRCLLKNRGVLGAQGIMVPGPTRYRTLLRDTAIALKGQAATVETQALVLEQIMDEEGRDRADASRLILSWENFLAFIPWAVDGGLYPSAGPRTQAFAQIFPGLETEFHLAIRNPASFLPLIFDRQKGLKGGKATVEAFSAGLDLHDLRWSEVIERILEANPEATVTVWCDEDTPLIWPEVLRAVAGCTPGTVLEDEGALVAELMSDDGQARMRAYVESHPVSTVAGRRKVVQAFLEKFGLREKIDQDIEMAGWTEATVSSLTQAYADDVDLIATLPGVTLIRP